MNKREKYENGIFTVRFIGEELKTRGVNIYDLSITLLSMQRIVHKAHLSLRDELEKGAFPDKEDRQELALQLGERRRTSDAFALIPVLTDPAIRDYLTKVADYVFSGVSSYFIGNVLDRVRREKNDGMRIYIGSIYTEMAHIGSRIDASGGLEAIALGAPSIGKETMGAFDADNKKYISLLKSEVVLGGLQEIKGRVYKLYPASKIVAIRRAGRKTVSVFLSEDDFDRIRYHQETNPMFIFKGRPRYQFGVVTREVSEFEADSIKHEPTRDS